MDRTEALAELDSLSDLIAYARARRRCMCDIRDLEEKRDELAAEMEGSLDAE